jgi:hypothetical protein
VGATGTIVVITAPQNTALPSVSGTDQDGQTLTAGNGSWSGSTPITYIYQWNDCNTSGANCAPISGATSQTYRLASSDVGSTVTVTVTATNTGGSSSASSAATSVVQASPPANTTAPSVSGQAKDGQTLSASNGSWTGSPPISYSYQWKDCDSSGANCQGISGATHQTYTLASSDVGHTVKVTVTASNSSLPGGGSSSADSAVTGVVQAVAPSNTALPTISGQTAQGQTLTTTNGSWSGSTPLAYSYQWRDCDSSGANCTDISGATSQTYTLAGSDVGSTIRVVVTASNASLPGGGSATATSAQTATVASPPTSTAPPAISGIAQAGQTLTTSNGSWSGSAPITFTYQWKSCDTSGNNCTDITNATAQSYQLATGDVGSTIRAVITASNTSGTGSATSSATDVVQPASGACTDSWTGGAGDGKWETPTNWSTGQAPGSNDVSCLPSGSQVSVTGSDQTGSLQATGVTITIGSGSLQILQASATSQLGSLSESGGQLTEQGTLSITNALTWTGGTISGTGTTTLAQLSSSTISPTGGNPALVLDGERLINQGALMLECSQSTDPTGQYSLVQGTNSAELENDASMTFAIPGGAGAAVGCELQQTSPVEFANNGSLTENGTGPILVGWEFASGGASHTTGVDLQLYGGAPAAIDGTWNTSNMELVAGGSYTMATDSSFGSSQQDGSTITVDGTPLGSTASLATWLSGSAAAPSATAGNVSWIWVNLDGPGPITLGTANTSSTLGDVGLNGVALTLNGSISVSSLCVDLPDTSPCFDGGIASPTGSVVSINGDLTDTGALGEGGNDIVSVTGSTTVDGDVQLFGPSTSLSSDGSLVFQGVNFDSFGGVSIIASGSITFDTSMDAGDTLKLQAAQGMSFNQFEFLDGQVTLSSPGTITFAGGVQADDGDLFTGGGTTTLGGDSDFGTRTQLLNERVVNNANLRIDGELDGQSGAVLDNHGTIDADSTNFYRSDAIPTLINEPDGSLVDSSVPVTPNHVAWAYQGGGSVQTGAYVFEGAGATEDQSLATKFMPVLLFDQQEKWRPLNVDDFLNETDPATGAAWNQICSPALGCSALQGSASLTGHPTPDSVISIHRDSSSDPDSYVSPNSACSTTNSFGTQLHDCDSGPASAIYYHIVGPSPGGYMYIDYWFFYRYNQGLADVGNHAGDWEGVTIVPGQDDNSIAWAELSHHGTWDAFLPSQLDCLDPQNACSAPGAEGPNDVNAAIFVASGSHANYPQADSDPLDDGPHGGEDPWGNGQNSSALLPFPGTAGQGNPWSEGPQNWTDWPGAWGDTGQAGFTGSPCGPAAPNTAADSTCGDDHAGHFFAPWAQQGSSLSCSGTACPQARVFGSNRGSQSQPNATPLGCTSWFGGGVVAAACDQRAMQRAVLHRRLQDRGGFTITLGSSHRRGATAPGLAQLVASPLQPGQVAILSGRVVQGTELFVRARSRRTQIAVTFESLPGFRGRGVIRVLRGPGGRPRVVIEIGRRRISPAVSHVEARPRHQGSLALP